MVGFTTEVVLLVCQKLGTKGGPGDVHEVFSEGVFILAVVDGGVFEGITSKLKRKAPTCRILEVEST